MYIVSPFFSNEKLMPRNVPTGNSLSLAKTSVEKIKIRKPVVEKKEELQAVA